MTPNDMRRTLHRLEVLVDGWSGSGVIPTIERDLALDRLRELYDGLLAAQDFDVEVSTSDGINLDEVLAVDMTSMATLLDEEPAFSTDEAEIEAEVEVYRPAQDEYHTRNEEQPADSVVDSEPEPEISAEVDTTEPVLEENETLEIEEFEIIVEDEPVNEIEEVSEPVLENTIEPVLEEAPEEVDTKSGSESEPAFVSQLEPASSATVTDDQKPWVEQTPIDEHIETEVQAEKEQEVLIEKPIASSEPQQMPQPTVQTLFGMDEPEELLRHRQKQRVLMSLYDMEEPAPAARPSVATAGVASAQNQTAASVASENSKNDSEAPKVERAYLQSRPKPKPAVQEEDDDEFLIEEIEIETEDRTNDASIGSGSVLGEVIGSKGQTLGDSFANAEPAHTTHAPKTGLRRMIGINDRYLMIRDLFGGDDRTYETTIDVLDEFDDLDDCMIYIAENYMWNPNSDGAKLLIGLLERKLA